MLDFTSSGGARAEITYDRPVEQLHHHPEQAAREGGVPSALGAVVADEGVLSLDFHELWGGGG